MFLLSVSIMPFVTETILTMLKIISHKKKIRQSMQTSCASKQTFPSITFELTLTLTGLIALQAPPIRSSELEV